MQDNSVIKLDFNKKFYKLLSIRQAIKDFGACLNGNVSESEGYFHTTLVLKDKSLQHSIRHEFANYVLALMKNETLV